MSFCELQSWLGSSSLLVCGLALSLSLSLTHTHTLERLNIKVVDPASSHIGLPSAEEEREIEKTHEKYRQFIGIPRRWVLVNITLVHKHTHTHTHPHTLTQTEMGPVHHT